MRRILRTLCVSSLAAAFVLAVVYSVVYIREMKHPPAPKAFQIDYWVASTTQPTIEDAMRNFGLGLAHQTTFSDGSMVTSWRSDATTRPASSENAFVTNR
ncbi:MAG: hypothetical protein K0S38_257 [Candidatus Paceibacter sp.]|jgi:hypothetical protein|nr:hypothetical protein [Candidatus Paceibacter sp.]